ncbi:hypothetical protein SLEP1_g2788 [Rubroshorea leprosula]|uniref:Cytochrome P450 n=1 Tax=Rubroshorea leprosula TaxID=152421 RepID=A0AAV5HPA3_9ROSI|nr:hypothetical protein SLEP1_g2788 [Rubroshorea leprosula]
MEDEVDLKVKLILAVALGGSVVLLVWLYNVMVVKTHRLRLKLQNQGIRGPSPSFLLGNIPDMRRIQTQAQSLQKDDYSSIAHDWLSTLLPYFGKWRNEYGPVFMYSTGNIQILCITDVEMVKEMSLHTSLSLGKPSYLSKDRGPLLGKGILSSSGPLWAHQRKIIAPEFFPDRVKGMVNLMAEATTSLLRSWESRIEREGGVVADITVDEDLRSLSADIISKTSFGSSYSKGEEIFSKLQTLQKVMSKGIIGIPALRYLPTKNNKEVRKLEKQIDTMILELGKQRMEGQHQEQDLLQLIVEGANSCSDHNGNSLNFSRDRFIIDNCKNIYFAGHETTAITASWSLMLLAAHPDWQAQARAEVLETCKGSLPNADSLKRMKMLTMVIQETLRLYPPAIFVIREALEDINIKGILVPKGMNIQIPIPVLHQSPELWGPDASKFNPERFVNGVLGACKAPQAYMPFGLGPRICAGQHFAMTELKVVLSLLLSRFSFSLSPEYHHSPAFRLVVQPEHGVCLQVRRV